MNSGEKEKTPFEKARDLGVPLIPKLPGPWTQTNHDVVAVCGECGRSIHRIEGYVCPNGRCPIQMKSIC